MLSNKKLYWTEHSKLKMKQYGLSKSKLVSLLYKPQRTELGIVEGTNAVMQTNKSYSKTKNLSASSGRVKKVPGEVWLMYKDVKGSSQGSGNIRKIISAWRYPGISKPGDTIPIPEDIRREIIKEIG